MVFYFSYQIKLYKLVLKVSTDKLEVYFSRMHGKMKGTWTLFIGKAIQVLMHEADTFFENRAGFLSKDI